MQEIFFEDHLKAASKTLAATVKTMSSKPSKAITKGRYNKPDENEFLLPGLHLVPYEGSFRESVMNFTPAIKSYLKEYWEANTRFSLTPQYVFLRPANFVTIDQEYTCFANARQNNIRHDTLPNDRIKSLEDIIGMATDKFLYALLSPNKDYTVRGLFIVNPHEFIKDCNEDLFKAFMFGLEKMSKHHRIPFYFMVSHDDLQDNKLRRLYHRRSFARTLGYNY